MVLFKHFAPLRDYLAEQIHENIVLETARDFSVYARRTAARRYDIVFTAPHMVMPALDSGHYELAATFIKPLSAVVAVKQDSPINNLQALADKRIATPPLQAIVTRVGIAMLKQLGILKHAATHLNAYHSHNAAYTAVLAGDADAAILANFIYQRALNMHKPLRQIAESRPFPGVGILLATDLPQHTRDSIKAAFIDMIHQQRGRELLKTLSQPGYTSADISLYKALQRFADDDMIPVKPEH